MSSTSSPATHYKLPLVSPVPSGNKRTYQYSLFSLTAVQDDPAPAQAAAKKAKSVDDVERDVADLLGMNIFVKDAAAKVIALRALSMYLASGDATNFADPQVEDYRRAIAERDGCHWVLLVLEVELGRKDGANSQVAHAALSFLKLWNCHCADRSDSMLRFNGVEILGRVMQVFPDESPIQWAGIACLYYFTRKDDDKHLEELVFVDCIPLIARAMTDDANGDLTRELALIILGRLCKVAGPDNFKGHVDATAFGALLPMFQQFESSGIRHSQEVVDSCRALASKMLE
jgi:hypothetical protein